MYTYITSGLLLYIFCVWTLLKTITLLVLSHTHRKIHIILTIIAFIQYISLMRNTFKASWNFFYLWHCRSLLVFNVHCLIYISRQQVKEAFVNLAERIANTSRDPSWLFLMPWIHFLSDWCRPFDTPGFNVGHDQTDPIWWGLSKSLNSAVEYFTAKTVWDM